MGAATHERHAFAGHEEGFQSDGFGKATQNCDLAGPPILH
jgi:hypothetical protein